jgi:hypothetical protein
MLTSITYRRLTEDSDGVLNDVDKRKAAVRSFLHDYALPELFQPVSEDTEILLEEFVGTSKATEYFAVIRIPAGAIERNALGERLDSIRALLIFPYENYMYMLGFDNMTVISLLFPPDDSDGKIDLVEYRSQPKDEDATQVKGVTDHEIVLDSYAKMARKRLADFKSTIIFK